MGTEENNVEDSLNIEVISNGKGDRGKEETEPSTGSSSNLDDESKKKKEEEERKKLEVVSFTSLYRYADGVDRLLILIASIASIGNGFAQPISFIIFGQLIQKFIDFGSGKIGDIEEQMQEFALYYIGISAGMFICAYFQAAFWSMAALRQIHRIRISFFKSILKQDVGWFDVNESGGLTTRLTDDLIKIQSGIGDKVGMTIQAAAMFFGGFGVGFYYSWELTLVILALSPAMVITGAITGKVLAMFSSKEQTAYASAGAVAEEVISSIRTVVAFGGEHDEIQRYNDKLADAEKAGITKSMLTGGAFGLFHIVMFACYAVAFWHGSNMVIDKKLQGGEVLIVFFCVIAGAAQLGQMSPSFEAINAARGAAYHVFNISAREPVINCLSEDGKKLEEVDGRISFSNVHFRYPSRPEVKVLDGFNLGIETGTTVALVGESGCGKSTIVKLVQRFYDTEDGMVALDGRDVKNLNVKSLRSNIGVVSQEPVLFDMTIAENIQFGAVLGASQSEIEEAAKNANAHDFIMNLPKGYDTNVGEGGAQLSGGQKQRIAIARALVRNPKILLFDEATSALDTESESIVQAALDKASKGRTTIIIAHRLSTVRNADVIVAVQDGKAAEMGTHKELMEKKGVYHQLVLLQTVNTTDGSEEELVAEMSQEDLEEIKKLKLMRSLSTLSNGSAKTDHASSHKFSRQLSRQSQTSLKKEKQESSQVKKPGEEEEEQNIEPASFSRVIKLNKSEWPYLVSGGFFAALVGIFPVAFAVILSELISVYQKDDATIKKESRKWALFFLGLGFFDAITLFLSAYLFGKAGEILTRRLRKQAFTAILRQEIAFFDDPQNGTGQLTARLATDASNVNGATSARLNSLTQVFVMGVTAVGVAMYFSWKLTLLILAFVPFLAIGGAAHMKVFTNFAEEEGKRLLSASALATQAIMNIRTVASLGKERYFIDTYKGLLDKPYRKSSLKANIFGLTFGLSSSIMMLANAAAFSFGGKLVQDREMKIDDMFKVVLATVFGALIAGQIASFAPDYVKAKVSAARIFLLLDRVPEIDSYSTEGQKLERVTGNITFSDVQFAYPSRPDVQVLKGLSLQIQPGQKVALVGSSGCGKSTSIGLLERFYNPLDGAITVDQNEIDTFNIKWWRSQLGLVSQEPVLFARSIKDNITYGLDRPVTDDEIESAAKKANIHSFVSSLPKGYETMVGEKGTLISGGQKQRVAVARALIRDPKIMLLDEATSALDSESEKIVQEALDVAMEGRTSIIIAHRLSTIQNADMIVVIQDGTIVERGTHQELIAKQGVYYNLNQAQL